MVLSKPLRLPKSLTKPLGQALVDYQMIKDNDRILLAVSGGKDSLTLFHLLNHFKCHAPVRFDLGVITVDPLLENFNPKPLANYFQKFSTPHFIAEFPMLEQAKKSMRGNSYCAFCARMKRGLMYATARREGYNVVALGQHLDDLAESLLMSLFHNGKFQTMKAHYQNDAGDLRIIRPLVYIRERQLADFAAKSQLPVVADSCPACFEKPTERAYFKDYLRTLEKRMPHIYQNILHAMRPILTQKEDLNFAHFFKKTDE